MNVRRHDFVATLTRSALAADYFFMSALPHCTLLHSFKALVHSFMHACVQTPCLLLSKLLSGICTQLKASFNVLQCIATQATLTVAAL